jgi:RNA recognition motif-containing protein
VKIYVGNLSYNCTENDLRELFEAHGQVDSTAIVKDRATGRSRGFGFVEMADRAQAEAAIEALNGTEHQGRRLNVNEARSQGEGRGPREPGGRRW